MPGKTAGAAVAGLVTGAVVAIAATDDISASDAPGMLRLVLLLFFPVAIVTLVAMLVTRRWLATNEERRRRDIEVLAEQRRLLHEDFNRRSQELAEQARRERASESERESYRRLVVRLDETLSALQQEQHERKQLQEDYDELAAEYTGLVMGTMQELADKFTKRQAPRPPFQRTPSRERRRERADGWLAQLPQSRQDDDEPAQHSRPAEG